MRHAATKTTTTTAAQEGLTLNHDNVDDAAV
jgi:hypothetical protein